MADAGRAARRSLERVNFNFTAKCNMACRFCYVPFDGEEGSEVEAFAVVDELLARDVKSITFAGGDPLMYPYLQTLISRVKDTTQRCSCNWIRMLYNFSIPTCQPSGFGRSLRHPLGCRIGSTLWIPIAEIGTWNWATCFATPRSLIDGISILTLSGTDIGTSSVRLPRNVCGSG
jgi:Radical SAM superfamily/4Fe-4S single cluster domain